MNVIKRINEKRRVLRSKWGWEKHKLSDWYYTCVSTKTKEYDTSLDFTSLAEIFPVGLGEAPGILTLYGASGPSASLVSGWAGYSNKYRQMIPINTLDTFLSGRYTDNAMAIKIDVEGAEFHVLKGAIDTLNRKRKPTWFLEICLDQFHPDSLNKNFLETFQLFFDSGYDAIIADKENTAVSIEDVRNRVKNRSTGHSEFNYVFAPSSK